MLTKAYEDGYRDGVNSVVTINAPTVPYTGDEWSNYSTTATNSMTIDVSETPLTSSGISVGSALEVPTITLASQTKVAKSSN